MNNFLRPVYLTAQSVQCTCPVSARYALSSTSVQAFGDQWAMASKDIPRPISRSKPRERSLEHPPDTLPNSLKAPRTVTFDLLPTKTLSPIPSSDIESPSQAYTTTISLKTVDSQDVDETADAHSGHSLNYDDSIEESSIHLPRFFHHHDPDTLRLANRLALSLIPNPCGRQFIVAGTLDKYLEKQAVERALEYLIAQGQIQSSTAHEKLPSVWRRMFRDYSTKSPRQIATQESTISPIANHIYHNLRNIFATLLRIEHPRLIVHFLQCGIEDKDLPLHKFASAPEEGNKTVYGLCVKDCSAHGSTFSQATCTRCLKGWPISLVNLFKETQWETLTPVFHAEEGQHPIHYPLHEHTVLPFTRHESIHRGSRREILKVRIHAKHHNFDRGARSFLSAFRPGESESESPSFAIKKIADQDEFHREVSILKRVVDDHVIPLFATYEQCGEYHLIMPWAECNLEQFWEAPLPQPASSGSNILRWMAKQCLGIASALRQVQHHLTFSRSSLFGESAQSGSSYLGIGPKKLNTTPRHAFFGRHGDIKPQNLLWFPTSSSTSHDTANLGTVKICDFGEGEFNKAQSVHRSTDSISYTPSYRPPECDHPDKEVEIQSGTYDTWSLGCVYLEFITWYLGGWKSVLEFEKSRYNRDGEVASSTTPRRSSPYFETTHQAPPQLHARIKPAVREHFRRLREIIATEDVGTTNHGERDFLTAFLNLIQAYMLVINPDGHEPRDGGSYRMTCNHVHEKLGDMGILIGIMDDVYDGDKTSRHRLRHLLRWHSSMALE
ncbi:hypothetical protein V8F06_008178 [Rhypophila decipiens]